MSRERLLHDNMIRAVSHEQVASGRDSNAPQRPLRGCDRDGGTRLAVYLQDAVVYVVCDQQITAWGEGKASGHSCRHQHRFHATDYLDDGAPSLMKRNIQRSIRVENRVVRARPARVEPNRLDSTRRGRGT